MNRQLRHPITDAEILAYEEDGAVCIRGQFDAEWIENMLPVCQAEMTNPTGRTRVVDNPDDPGYFFIDTYMSRQNPAFENYVLKSPAAEIAARLLRLDEVRFFYDQLFIKEPGTLAPTQWHHDLPFWPFEGNQIASVWLALTPVSMANSGLVYVAGSHKWDQLFRAVTPDEDESYMDDALALCPEFHKEFDNPDYRFLTWDMAPGDVIVHHPKAVHGTGRNQSTTQQRVGLSCRYFGGDAVYCRRNTAFVVPGAEGAPGVTPGQLPVNDQVFPVAWRAPTEFGSATQAGISPRSAAAGRNRG